MSEFSINKQRRLEKLKEVAYLLLKTGNAHSFIVQNKEFIPTVIPSDFISLFDEIIQEGYNMKDIKVLSNKILNIFHMPIKEYNRLKPAPDSFLGILEKNNQEMKHLLDDIRPVFKKFVKDVHDEELQKELKALFQKLAVFASHYTIKENILFPLLEATWPDHRCVKIMWSFHDDIRRNIKTIISQLESRQIDDKAFNKCVGDVFFNMLAIQFREEHILFPYILSTINEKQLAGMSYEGAEIGYPYIQPELSVNEEENEREERGSIHLGTGSLSVEQVKLIFNHLPVDITYVDEHNKVRFFSNPPGRIFPRTLAIIGRDVSNCHPPESVHVVEQIVESFRNGEKDHADFRIKMKSEYILIRYFAIRDNQGNYKGVIEVSQEISAIKSLKGEKRLLEW